MMGRQICTAMALAGWTLLGGMRIAAQEPEAEAWRGPVVPAEVRFVEYGTTQEVPGDSLYRRARSALNRREFEAAATQFQELRRRFPSSAFTPDTYYYEAFALYRLGQERSGARARESHQRALELLDRQAAEHGSAGTLPDARALRGRIQGELARLGDARSRDAVLDRAQQACDRSDQELRAAALSALLNMDEERALPILREVLANRDACGAELRAQAIFILAQHGGDEAVDALLDLASRDPDPDPEVRKAAVFWLSQVDRPEAVTALLDLLEDSDDPEILEQAIFALSQHDDPRAAEVLGEYARRSDVPAEARGRAIFWMGQSGGPEAVGALRELFAEMADPELKKAVLFAMSQRSEPGAREFLTDVALDRRQPPEVRKDALFWASQSGIPASELVDILRSSDDPEIREAVIFGLAQQRGPEAVDALMDVARSEDDPELREQAIFWLGQMDDPRIPEFLLELIRR
ncbi:MAG: HEAT repeat domain-containing protein [Gemmatimonadota bacterium]|nr:HEAT repeat domain-containing protein [Gemmatimonadota bacterium]